MAVTFSGSMVSALASDLVLSALRELNLVAADEALSATDQAWGVEKLQRIVDRWNAQRPLIFSRSFYQYTLLANHSPHTIGPSGDFKTGPAANYRPLDVFSCRLVLNAGSANPVDLPVRIRDDDWWKANPLKSLASSVVTDLYYSPDLPNGSLYFYPISNAAIPVRLETLSSLAQALAAGTTLAFAQGYWDALILELARAVAPSFGPAAVQMAATLEPQRIAALRAVLGNNDPPPRIDTASGMPGSGKSGRPDFNWLTGTRE